MKRSLWTRLSDTLSSKRELARLNHILIPERKDDRDRFRESRLARIVRPAFASVSSLSREGRVIFLMTVMIGFAGLDVGQSQVYLLFAMMFGALFTSLLARPFFRARRLSVAVNAPRRVTMDTPQHFAIRLVNQGEDSLAGVRVMTPFLPWDGAWVSRPDGASVVAPGREVVLSAEATFMARGEHHIDPFEAALLVPLGLALGPRRLSDSPRFVVVPKFAVVTSVRLPAALPRAQGKLRPSNVAGDAEFAGVRPYRVGDSLRHVHARTWIRTGKPHIKTFLAERNDRLGLVVLCDGDAVSEDTKEATLMLAAGVARTLFETNAGIERFVLGAEVMAIPHSGGRGGLDAVMDRLGLHRLRRGVIGVEPILEATSGLASAICVVCDDAPERATLFEALRRTGLSLRVVTLATDGTPSVGPHEARVLRGDVLAGKEVAC
jgi:uncharacterized protein (DUF58 family)